VSSPVSYLDPVQLQRDLGMRDLSEPAEGPHAIQILISQGVERLSGAWKCEVRWCRGPRIVPVTDNYDRLGYPAEAITRETRYTRYVDAETMLRSHSSAMIPPALRRLARQPGDDVLLACPGIVYRRDAIDWQHTGTPHQLDLWRITRRAMSNTDMDQMIAILLGALVPGLPHRQQSRTHPYTLDGRQVDVYHDGRWVEVGECGLAHPDVLAAAGLPGRSGLALGMGLDRLLMLVKHIPDIRLLRSGDPRITRQMLDLAPRGMPARRPLLASQPSSIPARGFLHAWTVFPRAYLASHNVGPEAPYASWACQPAPATFAGYARAYFQPASLRFFSHTPNTPNCATQ
jgi:phenylalanyl-tRNA synthetase alpha chain